MSAQKRAYVRLTVRIPRKEQDRLRALAHGRETSMAALARQAIDDYLDGEDRAINGAQLSEAARQRAHLRLMRTTISSPTAKRRPP